MDLFKAFKDAVTLAKKPFLTYAYATWIAVALTLAIMPLAAVAPLALETIKNAPSLEALLTEAFSAAGILFNYYILAGLVLFLSAVFLNAFIASHVGMRPLKKEICHHDAFSNAFQAFPNALLAVLIVLIASQFIAMTFSILSSMPLAGGLFKFLAPFASLLLAATMLFTFYASVLQGKNAFYAAAQSASIFFKHPLQTTAVLGLSTLSSMAIIVLGALPLAAAIMLFGATTLFSPSNLASLAGTLLLAISAAVLLISIAFAKVLSIGIEANAYAQLSAEMDTKTNRGRKG